MQTGVLHPGRQDTGSTFRPISRSGHFWEYTITWRFPTPFWVSPLSARGPRTTTGYARRTPGGRAGIPPRFLVVTVPPPPLAQPGTSVTRTGFTAAWNAAQGATGYRIDVAPDSLFVSGLVENDSSAGSGLSAAVTGLNPGTLYYFRVRAANAGGASGNSNRYRSQPSRIRLRPLWRKTPPGSRAGDLPRTGTLPPARPATGSTLSTDSLFLSGFVRTDSSVGDVLSAHVTGLFPATLYFYRVRAENPGGASAEFESCLRPDAPSPPESPSAKPATVVSGTGFKANWGTAAGATGYRLDVSQDNLFGSFVGAFNNLSVTDTSEAVGSLAPGTAYYLQGPCRERSGGRAGIPPVMTVTTVPLPPVAAPAGNVTSTAFRANWSASAGASAYRLDVASDSLFVTGFMEHDTALGNVLSWPRDRASAFCDVLLSCPGGKQRRDEPELEPDLCHDPSRTLPGPPVAIAPTGITASGFTARWDSSHFGLSVPSRRLDRTVSSHPGS